MPAGVKEALVFALGTHGGFTAVDAKGYVDSMVREGRLMEECWS
jgi:sulfite reductase alpha subunit-like flavoprotein